MPGRIRVPSRCGWSRKANGLAPYQVPCKGLISREQEQEDNRSSPLSSHPGPWPWSFGQVGGDQAAEGACAVWRDSGPPTALSVVWQPTREQGPGVAA